MNQALVRLKRREEFLRVASARRKWVAPGLILQARTAVTPARSPLGKDGGGGPAAIGEGFRVGFTVSRKVGNAVARNRARRRLRAAAAEVMPRHAKAAHDFVVIGRSGTLTRPYTALVGDLKTALRHLGAFRGGPERERGREGPEREQRAREGKVDPR
ncbi:MAG: ribonuclease P protein component [Proteobacteria bacterium]|nr:ribonuclease P protein component [Pseudomonadota bacterium]